MRRFLEVLRRPKEQLQAMAKNAHSNRSQGEKHFEAGEFEEAEKKLALAAEERGGSAGKRVQIRLQLCAAQRKQLKIEEAEQSARRALEAAEKDPGLRLLCLHMLGEILVERGNFEDARTMLEEAVGIGAQSKDPDSIAMARDLRQLGIACHQLGRREESAAKLGEAAALYEQNFGEMHADTAMVLAELGAAYRGHEKYQDAEKCFVRALDIHQKTCGRKSGEVLRDLTELAKTLAEAGDLKRAIAEYERALTMQESVIGATFEKTAELQLTLAGLYVDADQLGRAQELLTHAAGGLRKGGGARLAIAHEAMAHVHERLGRFENALAELDKAAKAWSACGRTEELALNAEHQAELVARMPKEEEPSTPVRLNSQRR